MSLRTAFNINRHLLALAAKTDCVPLAEFSYSRTDESDHSRALRIATENKSLNVISHILKSSAQTPAPTASDERFRSAPKPPEPPNYPPSFS